ncbi:hypothetical protein ACGFYE_31195 [Streptomyces zaomyceticus]
MTAVPRRVIVVIEAAPARTLDRRRAASFPDDRVPWEGVRFEHH